MFLTLPSPLPLVGKITYDIHFKVTTNLDGSPVEIINSIYEAIIQLVITLIYMFYVPGWKPLPVVDYGESEVEVVQVVS